MEKTIENFKIHLINEEKSSATVEKYLRDVKMMVLWLDGREPTKALVVEYKNRLIEKYSPMGVNSVISSLNSFFCFIGRYELKLKLLKLQMSMFSSKEKELTKKEYERLLLAAKDKGNQRLLYIMQTICSCGIRVSELKFITVSALREKRAMIRLKGKMRVIIIPDKLCCELLKYVKARGIKEGAVFITRTGKPLDRSAIWKMMKKLCNTARVSPEKVFPHNLRHLFARTFYQAEKDIVRLSDILGHSSIDTTRIYTIETGTIHRKKLCRLGLLLL